MANVDDLIEKIIEASRANAGRTKKTSRVYGSEPIIMRGSQLRTYVPERVREMRRMAKGDEARGWTDARLFVEQARLMEDYEDDCPYAGSFQTHFPTYDVMDNAQLRGYFTWRANVRRGTVERTCTSFAYVYVYELLNGVGVEPGEPGFRAIESFWRSFREFDPTMDRYVRHWLVDYAVYHGLDPELARPYAGSVHNEAVAYLAAEEEAILGQPAKRGRKHVPYPFGEHPDEEARLLEALDAVSTYRPLGSRLYKDDPEALRSVTCAVFARLVRYYHGSRSQDLVESLFGIPLNLPYLMFGSAVFYPAERHRDCTYHLDRTCTFTCRKGIWRCETLHDGGGRSSRLGEILRATDRMLRAALSYPHPLKDRAVHKYLAQIIDREVGDFIEWRKAGAARRVEIDLSKLAGIRSAAATTREALLVDEEREDGPEEAAALAASGGKDGGVAGGGAPSEPVAPSAADTPTDTPTTGSPLGLTPDELRLLEDLLAGRKPAATSVDLLVDSINEKLFDLVGDTVLEFDDSGEPTLIEDYVEDVRAALA